MLKRKRMKWKEVQIPVAAIAKQGKNLTPEEALSLVNFREQMRRIDIEKELARMNYTEAEIMRVTINAVVLAMENHNAQMDNLEDRSHVIKL